VLLAAMLGAPAAAQDGADAPDREVTSIARPCLNHPTIRRTRILDDRNIVFITRDGTIYNNQLPRQCPSLKRGSVVNYGVANGRLCSGDSFQVLWQVGTGNYVPAFQCPLGHFLPISAGEFEDLTAVTEQSRERRPRRRSSHEAVTVEPVELPPPATAPSAAQPAATE
jgi:hypothetical protein